MKDISLKFAQKFPETLWITDKYTIEKELEIPNKNIPCPEWQSIQFASFSPRLFLKNHKENNSKEVIIFDMTPASGYTLKNLIQVIAQYKDQILLCIIVSSDINLGIVAIKEGADDFILSNAISMADLKQKVTIAKLRRKKEKEALEKAKKLSLQSIKQKEQFLASVSHEMRTPLNAIIGMSNLTLTTNLTEEQLTYINSINHSSEILLGVVNDILQISEMQNKKINFDNKPFDLHELVYNLINVMQYKVQEKKLSLELSISDDIPRVIKGDQLRLNQILYNLVGNAIKFTDKGSVKIIVNMLSQNQYSTQLEFRIEDTGIGIPEEKQKMVFDSFSRIQTKDRVFEGTGLGLSIAKDFVELQGGKINLISTLGKGTTFFFDLVFEVGDTLEKQMKYRHPNKIDLSIHFQLLLVEDNKLNQIVAKKTLQKRWKNIEITIANNGVEAIEILQTQYFNIILMDIQMPKMNGFETTQYIRQKFLPPKTNIPILAMTAHSHISKDKRFETCGMNDYLLKPFNPQQLFEKIEIYL